MIIGVLKESGRETRVSLLPEHVPILTKLNCKVIIEKDAGKKAFFADNQYIEAGASIESFEYIVNKSDLLLFVNSPGEEILKKINHGTVIAGTLNPLGDNSIIDKFNKIGLTSFSMDQIPRTTRAQSMDVLSNMATVAGYKAVLDASRYLPRFFPMFMSAAGTIRPSRVLILGAGVAGLQAIATARKLGAIVEVFDVRSAVKEEVLSLGGKFIEIDGSLESNDSGGYAIEQTENFKERQALMIHKHAIKANAIICTAQIPGRRAPLLIKKSTVEQMMPGSVIIDLAASTGGNCELSENNKIVTVNDVTIIGESNYSAKMPTDASKMYGTNITNFIKLIINDKGGLNLNFDDEIVKGTCLTHDGELVNERVKSILNK